MIEEPHIELRENGQHAHYTFRFN
uniref:Uncharacterized protein n=1 Tax=Arundo donax TaxID=35708 RepID=A0A0A9GYS9_ARUDO